MCNCMTEADPLLFEGKNGQAALGSRAVALGRQALLFGGALRRGTVSVVRNAPYNILTFMIAGSATTALPDSNFSDELLLGAGLAPSAFFFTRGMVRAYKAAKEPEGLLERCQRLDKEAKRKGPTAKAEASAVRDSHTIHLTAYTADQFEIEKAKAEVMIAEARSQNKWLYVWVNYAGPRDETGKRTSLQAVRFSTEGD